MITMFIWAQGSILSLKTTVALRYPLIPNAVPTTVSTFIIYYYYILKIIYIYIQEHITFKLFKNIIKTKYFV